MNLEKEMRTAVFIDGANLFYVEKSLDFNISFERLAYYFHHNFNIYNIYYYTGVDLEDEKENEFLDGLAHFGITVRKKPLKIIKTGPLETDIIKKANLDVEMVVDMINTVPLYDRLILVSGDSDFVRALELIRSHGKEIYVMSERGHIAKELLNAADSYMDISKIKNLIFKKRFYKKNPAKIPSTANPPLAPNPPASQRGENAENKSQPLSPSQV